MIRKMLLALALVAGLASTGPAAAGPFFNRPTPPTASELGLDATQAAQWQTIQADAQASSAKTSGAPLRIMKQVTPG